MDESDRKRQLDALLDKAEILECLHRYTRGMDRLDFDLVRSAYHEDAVDDHIGFVGTVDQFIEWVQGYHANQIRHQHYISNHCVELNGDEAHAETYFTFVGTEKDPDAPLTMYGGRYVDRFEKRRGRWAIAARVCVAEWMLDSAKSGLSPEAFEYVSSIANIARDKSDISYERPLVPKRTS